ncbi:MAG: saccharopine dehydrogenase family protein [Solirubrobacteraceae bacterium]
MNAVVLYGATGYAGRLTADAMHEAGLLPVLAGRRPEAVRMVAEPLGLPIRSAALEDPASADRLLDGAAVLVNCAGPFAATQRPLVDACIRTGTHYLDLAGEVPEHRSLEARDHEARAAEIMLLPGAGFGCVPTDCLAAHVAARVPNAKQLELAFKTVGGVSRGTAQTLLGSLHRPGVLRHNGELVPARAAEHTTTVDFQDGDGPTIVVTNPWRADLVTTGHSTNVPNVETFAALPTPVRVLMRHGRRARPLLDSRLWPGLLRTITACMPEGPDRTELDTGRSVCWARATASDGTVATSTLRGPDAYLFTAMAATMCTRLILTAHATPGYATPATAFGADSVLDIPGVARTDQPLREPNEH